MRQRHQRYAPGHTWVDLATSLVIIVAGVTAMAYGLYELHW